MESFLEEVLSEMDFNWGFSKMKKRATAFQIEGTRYTKAHRNATARRALGAILHGQNKDCG